MEPIENKYIGFYGLSMVYTMSSFKLDVIDVLKIIFISNVLF